eukprot:89885-Rhodomonas_salina.1
MLAKGGLPVPVREGRVASALRIVRAAGWPSVVFLDLAELLVITILLSLLVPNMLVVSQKPLKLQ